MTMCKAQFVLELKAIEANPETILSIDDMMELSAMDIIEYGYYSNYTLPSADSMDYDNEY